MVLNMDRRHLTGEQKKRVYVLVREQRGVRERGSNQYQAKVEVSNDTSTPPTQADYASEMGVSLPTVKRWEADAKVLDAAPDMKEAVMSGEKTVRDAVTLLLATVENFNGGSHGNGFQAVLNGLTPGDDKPFINGFRSQTVCGRGDKRFVTGKSGSAPRAWARLSDKRFITGNIQSTGYIARVQHLPRRKTESGPARPNYHPGRKFVPGVGHLIRPGPVPGFLFWRLNNHIADPSRDPAIRLWSESASGGISASARLSDGTILATPSSTLSGSIGDASRADILGWRGGSPRTCITGALLVEPKR